MTSRLELLPTVGTHNFLTGWTAQPRLAHAFHCLVSCPFLVLSLLFVAHNTSACCIPNVHSLTDTLDDFRSSSFLPMTDACCVPMLQQSEARLQPMYQQGQHQMA